MIVGVTLQLNYGSLSSAGGFPILYIDGIEMTTVQLNWSSASPYNNTLYAYLITTGFKGETQYVPENSIGLLAFKKGFELTSRRGYGTHPMSYQIHYILK